jgi:acyl-CoA dehydrogenase
LDFTISPEHKKLVDQIATELAEFDDEYWARAYGDERFPAEFWRKLSERKWLGLHSPVQYGGLGSSLLDLAVAIEAVGASAGGVGAAYPMVSHVNAAHAIAALGTEQQKKQYLPELSRGQIRISLALTEEQSGLDALGIQTSAERVNGHFVIDGEKFLINEADRADLLILAARTTPLEQASRRSHGLTLFLVNARDRAIKSERLEKIGLNHLTTCALKIESLNVPADSVLGEVDAGWQNLVGTLTVDRITNAAMCVGAGELAIRRAVDYAKSRKVLGGPIGANQGLQFPLAEAKSELELARLLTYKAAWLEDRGERADAVASMAILRASESAFHAADVALQVHGGHGYLKDYPVERYWRDLRLFKLGPVSHELTLASIAERVLGLPKSYSPA